MIGIKDSSCLLRFPKAAKRVTVEYVPNDQHWSSATNWVRTNIPRPEDKLILHIVDREFVPLNNLSMWKQDAKGWWIENPDGTYLTNQWFESNGLWYYMGADGYMLTNTTTPDGYKVNADGVRVE